MTGSSILDSAVSQFRVLSDMTFRMLTEDTRLFLRWVRAEDLRQRQIAEAWRLHNALSDLEVRIIQSLPRQPARGSKASRRKRVVHINQAVPIQDHGTAAQRAGIIWSHQRWAALHGNGRHWRDARAAKARRKNPPC